VAVVVSPRVLLVLFVLFLHRHYRHEMRVVPRVVNMHLLTVHHHIMVRHR